MYDFSTCFSGHEPCAQLTESMNLLNYWTFCLIFLTINPRFSSTFNDTDSVGAEVKFNATWGGYIPTTSPRKHELHIAGFFNLDSRNGAGSLEAARMAVEEINSDSRYLEDYEIVLHQEKSTKVKDSFSFLFFSLIYKSRWNTA